MMTFDEIVAEYEAAERERQGCTDDMYCVCDEHAHICPVCGARYSVDDLSWQFEQDDYTRCGHVKIVEV